MSFYVEGLDLPSDGYRELVVYANGDISAYDPRSQCYQETHAKACNIPPHCRLIDVADVFSVLDRFAGYLDDDMISRIKHRIHRDCPNCGADMRGGEAGE